MQHKPNFTSANKCQPQIKPTDGSKAFSQPKHKQEGTGKVESSKNTSKANALGSTACELVHAENAIRVPTSTSSTQTNMTRPKTEPVPVPPSPKTSS